VLPGGHLLRTRGGRPGRLRSLEQGPLSSPHARRLPSLLRKEIVREVVFSARAEIILTPKRNLLCLSSFFANAEVVRPTASSSTTSASLLRTCGDSPDAHRQSLPNKKSSPRTRSFSNLLAIDHDETVGFSARAEVAPGPWPSDRVPYHLLRMHGGCPGGTDAPDSDTQSSPPTRRLSVGGVQGINLIDVFSAQAEVIQLQADPGRASYVFSTHVEIALRKAGRMFAQRSLLHVRGDCPVARPDLPGPLTSSPHTRRLSWRDCCKAIACSVFSTHAEIIRPRVSVWPRAYRLLHTSGDCPRSGGLITSKGLSSPHARRLAAESQGSDRSDKIFSADTEVVP
jgi:hypothetical protein